MSNHKRAMFTHQEGGYLDEEDDVFFNQLGMTRRRVANVWDEHTDTEALMWRFFGIDD
jgi:hypothetical protein